VFASLLAIASAKFVAPMEAQITPAIDAKAQDSGAITGTLRRASIDRPVAYASVQLAGTSLTAETNGTGRFELRPVPPGVQALVMSAPGLMPVRIVDVVVKPDETTSIGTVDLQLAPLEDGVQPLEELVIRATQLTVTTLPGMGLVDAPAPLSQVVVTPSSFGIADERGPASVTLTNRELQNLPQLGEDLYRTISRLPGLAADDISSAFWVRGAPNSQMLARFDGVDLIEPFHLKDFDGTLSIIDLETIRDIDIVTGGFTTDYGDHLAGVLTMETQDSLRGDPRTTLGLSVTNMRATNQGAFAGGDGQWMVAARRGYLDLALKLGGNNSGLSPDYYDISSKVEYRINPQQTVSIHVLCAGDALHQAVSTDDVHYHSSYASEYVWGRWQGSFGDRLTNEAVLSYSYLDWNRGGTALYYGVDPLSLSDQRRLDVADLRDDWTLKLTEHALLRGGIEGRSGEAHYDYDRTFAPYVIQNGIWVRNPENAAVELAPTGDYSAAYVATRIQPFTPLVIEPGLRFEQHDYIHDSGWSPRFNVSLSLTPQTTLRAAWGLYRQAQGLQDLDVQDGLTKFARSERAEQRVIGLSHRLPTGENLRVEAYERLSSDLHPYYSNPIDPNEYFPEMRFDRTLFDPSNGRARGVEFIVDKRAGKRFGWSASYALSRSEELIDGRYVPVARDQTQTFYTDMSYAPARDWRIGMSWQYHTGWPTTALNYSMVGLADGTFYPLASIGALNALRLPAYHRLDLRATRRYALKQGELRVFVDVFNAYDRLNQSGASYTPVVSGNTVTLIKSPNTLFPILPTGGISWEF